MTSEQYRALQRDVQMHMLPRVQRIQFLNSVSLNDIDQEHYMPSSGYVRQRTEIAEYKLGDY